MTGIYRNRESSDSPGNEIFTLSGPNRGMAFEPGKLDHLLAEAVGGDSAVAGELRALFLASATMHVAALSQAGTIDVWRCEALKLQGLAASFAMAELMEVAARAAATGPDPLLLDAVADALAACR